MKNSIKQMIELCRSCQRDNAKKYNKNKGKEVCRRATTDNNVSYAGEGRRGNNKPRGEQLRLDAGMSQSSNLILYAMIGIAVLGIYMQYKS